MAHRSGSFRRANQQTAPGGLSGQKGLSRMNPLMNANPANVACQRLQDSILWSSDEARTNGCLPLVRMRESKPVRGWTKRYAMATVTHLLPIALDAVGLTSEAQACRKCQTLKSARAAAWRAEKCACSAASAAAYADEWASCSACGAVEEACCAAGSSASSATGTAESAPWVAAWAARSVCSAARVAQDPDKFLRHAVQLLIACHSGSELPVWEG